jgi:phenylacetate-CoA ligase
MDANKIIKLYEQKPEKYWMDIQKKNMPVLFKKMSTNVPGYKNFLKQNHFPPQGMNQKIRLETAPYIDKGNYFQKYPLNQVLWRESLQNKPLVFTSTSGSTGLPTYFLREESLDWQYSILAEMFINNGRKGSTLFIDCFGMGVWIGGLITYQAFRYCALRGYPVTIITPGINKKEIFHCLKNVAMFFDNIVLAGYPPFIKDVIDEASFEGIDFSKFHIRLLFAAEGFTEHFRDYLAENTGIKNVYFNTLNIYGTAELGAMAFETPTTILIRRLALNHLAIFEKLFRQEKLPTLVQFNPMFVNFEEKNNQIFISADSATPLFRYRIGDNGGVLQFGEIENIFKQNGVNLKKEAKKQKINLYQLPFVYIYERTDLSTKLYGAIIYPEPIKDAVIDKKLNRYLTGKFTMITRFDSKHDEYLEINLELMPNIKPQPKHIKLCQELIVKNLISKNAEYKNNYNLIQKKVIPKIIFWVHGHPKYFNDRGKHKWTKKN